MGQRNVTTSPGGERRANVPREGRARRPLSAPDPTPGTGTSVGNKNPPDADAPGEGVQKGTHVILYDEDRAAIGRLRGKMMGRQTMGSVLRAALHWADKNGFPGVPQDPKVTG